ncbi:hypothetical protein JXJ21_00630 [candidate division KSB1 bacterium]|nr:hypothetical protein [candidate division KSB1 bacterium]
MRKQKIEYSSPLEALIAIAKRLQTYENRFHITSEEFFDKFSKGQLEDSIDFTEWSNDYQHYLSIKFNIEGLLKNVA